MPGSPTFQTAPTGSTWYVAVELSMAQVVGWIGVEVGTDVLVLVSPPRRRVVAPHLLLLADRAEHAAERAAC